MRGFSFKYDGTRHRVVAWQRVPGLQRLFHQQVDNRAVLCMQCDHATIGPHQPKYAKNGGIIGHHHAWVCHKHFEARHTFVTHGEPHVGKNLLVYARDNHVQAEGNCHLPLSLALRTGDRA